MIMGIVPLAIQEPMRTPTLSMIRMAGMALWMLSTIPRSMSFQAKRRRTATTPVRKAAATSRTWGLIL
jgi:hypothetical protein